MIMADGGLQKLRETAVKSACLLEVRVGWRHAGVGKQDRRRGRLRRTHYVYEPSSFVPAAQAVREEAIESLDQPEYGDYYRQDEDPLWLPCRRRPHQPSTTWRGTTRHAAGTDGRAQRDCMERGVPCLGCCAGGNQKGVEEGTDRQSHPLPGAVP